MGTSINIRVRSRMRGDGNDEGAASELLRLLVTDYDQVKQCYLALPSDEVKSTFINLFEDIELTEQIFLMGAWRMEMILNEI